MSHEAPARSGESPEPITLYTYAASPYGARVYWSLVYKRLPFALVYVDPFRRRELAFTGQRMVPVLAIGSEWRHDSTPICEWLEERHPEPRLLGDDAAERSRILGIDRWVSERLITLGFRHHLDARRPLSWIRNGQRLGAVNRETSGVVPRLAVALWPLILTRAGFVREGAKRHAAHRTLEEANAAVVSELRGQLGDGPFLGGLGRTSLADLAAYGQLVKLRAVGLEGYPDFARDPVLVPWIRRVEAALPDPPTPHLMPGRRLRLMAD